MLKIDEKTGKVIIVMEYWGIGRVSGAKKEIFNFLVDVCYNIPEGTEMNFSGLGCILQILESMEVNPESLSKEEIKKITVPTLEPDETPAKAALRKMQKSVVNA